MTAYGPGVRVARVSLAAATLTAVRPLIQSRKVSIGNATAGDLYVYTADDESEYVIIAAGYEREIELTNQVYRPEVPAFWLKSAGGGTAVVLWTL